MVRILTSADTVDLIDLPAAIECLDRAHTEQARGSVAAWPPSLMRSGGALLILRSGGLAERGRYGVRISSGPENASHALIFESPGGRLIGFMGYPFSDLRLAASVAVGLGHLAPPVVRKLALLGSGRLAFPVLEAAHLARPFEKLAVYSPTGAHRRRFADEAGERLGVSAEATDDPRLAVEDADAVLVVTNSRSPALQGAWLKPSAHVTAVGVRTEVDEDVFLRASLIVTTSKVQEMNIHDMREDWPLVRLTRSGRLTLDSVAELGDVVAGRIARPDGITVFRDAQGGFSDIALAALAYERAVALGRGTDIDVD
jgi:ornithine cyclodeaminase